MDVQNKTTVISANDNSLNIDSIKEAGKTIASANIKYPMLLFSNQYLKQPKNKTFTKRLLFKSQTIFLLNITDIIFTWLFVIKNTDFFLEANPLANSIINNFPLATIIKLSVVFAILLYIKTRANNASYKSLKRINITLNLIMILYFSINLLHIFNLIVLIYTKF